MSSILYINVLSELFQFNICSDFLTKKKKNTYKLVPFIFKYLIKCHFIYINYSQQHVPQAADLKIKTEIIPSVWSLYKLFSQFTENALYHDI